MPPTSVNVARARRRRRRRHVRRFLGVSRMALLAMLLVPGVAGTARLVGWATQGPTVDLAASYASYSGAPPGRTSGHHVSRSFRRDGEPAPPRAVTIVYDGGSHEVFSS